MTSYKLFWMLTWGIIFACFISVIFGKILARLEQRKRWIEMKRRMDDDFWS